MRVIIGAEAAKLAGLQIDTLQKVRSGPTKFTLLVDLGIITVPDDYDHTNRLATFKKKNRNKFYYYDEDVTDAHFLNPSRILKPGDKIRVRAFKQIVRGTTTTEDCMAFLATQKAVYIGAQGSTLVFEQKRSELPKGYWYTSFDEKEHLWEDADGYHRVLYVYAYSFGGFDLSLGYFGAVWHVSNAFLCICDE